MPSDALRDLVSARLAAARKEAGVTQKTLGALARVEPCAPCRYEGGFHVPTLRILAQLASALGRTPSELLRELSPPSAVEVEILRHLSRAKPADRAASLDALCRALAEVIP